MALPILIKLAAMAGVAVAGGYAGYKCGTKSGINRFLATADDYDGLVSDEELAADVEEVLVEDDDEDFAEEGHIGGACAKKLRV